MFLVRHDGKKEHEQQINRLIINRVKIDRLFEANQNTKWPVEARYARVRNRDSAAGTCRPQLFSLQKRARNQFGRQFQCIGGALRQPLQQQNLAGRKKVSQHVALR